MSTTQQVDALLEAISGGDLPWEERFLSAAIELTNAMDWVVAATVQLNSARSEINRLLEEKGKMEV